MFFYKFCWILLLFWFCEANLEKILEDVSSKNTGRPGLSSVIVVPVIVLVSDPKNTSKILQELGLERFPTIHQNGMMYNDTKEGQVPVDSNAPKPDLGKIDPGQVQTVETTNLGNQKHLPINGETTRKPDVGGKNDKLYITGSDLFFFWEAHQFCVRHNMALPVLKSTSNFLSLLPILDIGKEYWIGLTKANSPFVTKYYWMDGDSNIEYVQLFAKLSPKIGPAEYCTIKLSRGKKDVAVVCKPVYKSRKARYACVSENFYQQPLPEIHN